MINTVIFYIRLHIIIKSHGVISLHSANGGNYKRPKNLHMEFKLK